MRFKLQMQPRSLPSFLHPPPPRATVKGIAIEKRSSKSNSENNCKSNCKRNCNCNCDSVSRCCLGQWSLETVGTLLCVRICHNAICALMSFCVFVCVFLCVFPLLWGTAVCACVFAPGFIGCPQYR